MKKAKKVVAFGTFSIIHPGHIHYLKEAKKRGTHLTVIIATDKNSRKEKGKSPMFSQKERKEALESLRFVDKVVIGDERDFFLPLKRIKPDIIAIGYDGKCKPKEMEKALLAKGIRAKVVRMRRYRAYSTTRICGK